MKSWEKIREALKETKILQSPDKLISNSSSTTLYYYVLSEPFYMEAFKHQGPETKIREGKITWAKPKLLTPGYILSVEGFSEEAKKVLQVLGRKNPDLGGVVYKWNYKKESLQSSTVSKTLEAVFEQIKDDIEEDSKDLSVIIKGVDELWDVSLMKFIQELIIKSAYFSQLPHYQDKGFLRTDEKGQLVVTRNLEGLPIVAHKQIEKMFALVKRGELDPGKLKQELDRWGVFPAYEDRFFDLFRKE